MNWQYQAISVIVDVNENMQENIIHMENISSTETSIFSSNNSLYTGAVESSSKKSIENEPAEDNNGKQELILDLRNLSSPCGRNTENENSSIDLSLNIDQPNDQLTAVDSHPEAQQDTEEIDTKFALQSRIQSLQEVMTDLKETLQQEVALWKQEKEEFQVLREKSDILALEEATAAARAAAAAYAAEGPLSNDMGDVLDITSEETLRELTILEYEKKLAKYQDEFSLNQAEKRYNTRWQLVAQAYKQKLIEVERLCNEELEKVRRNASHLQELKNITTQWYDGINSHGDVGLNFSRVVKDKNFNDDNSETYYNFRKIDAEVSMIPEIYSARFKPDDIMQQDRIYGHV